MNGSGQDGSGLEHNVIRALAVIALVVAAMIAAYITFNSGIFEGSDSATDVDVTTVSTVEEAAGDTNADTPAVTETTEQNTYEIQPNDSFATIAEQYNTSIARIVELNPNLDPQNLKPGTVINVP